MVEGAPDRPRCRVHDELVRARVADLSEYLDAEVSRHGQPDWPSVLEWAQELVRIADTKSTAPARDASE